jgi:hypothetical protein
MNTSPVETVVPIVKNIEKEEEECNETEGLNREQQVGVTIAPVGSGEGDGDDPEVREDQVEQENEAWRDNEEESQGEERRREDRLLNVGVSHCSPIPHRL